MHKGINKDLSTAPGWKEVEEGIELYFVDEEHFVYTCCQVCEEWVFKTLHSGKLTWTCKHGE